MYFIGYDIGSSSIKCALVNREGNKTIATVQYPHQEMPIQAVEPGWAEQDPEMWWENVGKATRSILEKTQINPADIKAIGIAYQMHGLVLTDDQGQVLRPSIIWCDSRAVEIGNQAFQSIGAENCLRQLLNSPGNFTASKLKWVKENEPGVYERIRYFMLPGDYIAFRMTQRATTTISGLSEGIFWDFEQQAVSDVLLDEYGINRHFVPEILPTFSIQGLLSEAAAEVLGLSAGTPVSYRAGDQPNNALSLDILEPGEVAATGGTSGVVYGVVDRPQYDPASRVNAFAHVNYSREAPRIGILLCINGSGILYSWMKHNMSREGLSYSDMEVLASKIPIGSDGLVILPFGNGAERMLENKNIGAQFLHVELNRHHQPHFYRAALEGIAFSFVYGIEVMRSMGLNIQVMRVGNDNLFQSAVFSETIATLVEADIEVVETTGAVGAAKGAGFGIGQYGSLKEAMSGNHILFRYQPVKEALPKYQAAYDKWVQCLKSNL